MPRLVPNLLLTSVITVVQTGCWSRCGTFAGTWPLEVNLDRISSLAVPEDVKSIRDWFPWMKVTIHHDATPPKEDDGIIDLLIDNGSFAGPRNNSIIYATLHVDLDEAQSYFGSECRGRNSRYFEQHAARETSDDRGQYCISDIVRLRNDPEGGCLAIEDYASFLIIRRGRIVLSITAYAGTREESGAATRDYLEKLTRSIEQAISAPS